MGELLEWVRYLSTRLGVLAMAERAIILIPDISGFTGFTGATEIDHAAHIITELLELIVASNETAFTLAELPPAAQGDRAGHRVPVRCLPDRQQPDA